jgi:TonB family protein
MNSEVVTQVMPDLLPAAVRSIQGKLRVKVRVTVDPSGNVSDAEFDSEGPSKYFSKAAMDAAQKWKFKPAESGGQSVPSDWILDFQFKQSGVEVTPTRASH